MRFLLVITLSIFIAEICLGDEKAFEVIRQFAGQHDVPKKNIQVGLEGAVWKKDKSAVAVCFLRRDSTLCLVAYRSADGFSISDVSRVESMNFGKLGFCRSHYSRFITEPIKWNETGRFIYTNFGGKARHQISFRTRAWKGRQRYTVGEPLILDADWKPLWR